MTDITWKQWFDARKQGPILWPILGAYGAFMNLERGNKFPFYISPKVQEGDQSANSLLDFIDNLVDIHEIERNKKDLKRNFYDRLLYSAENHFRLSNDTMVNLMFDTKLTKPQYDRLNNAIAIRHTSYLVFMTGLHTLGFTSLCYFFRYRKLTIAP